MSKKLGFDSTPTAPPLPPPEQTDSENFQHFQRAPPPSYEESQKMINFHQQQYLCQQQPQYPPPNYNATAGGSGYVYNPAIGFQNSYGVYNTPTPSTPHYGQASSPARNTQNKQSITSQVVQFDSGARFKGKGAGSLTIPPPPPGYVPTPAQIAAMQGQPVVFQKKKKSFF